MPHFHARVSDCDKFAIQMTATDDSIVRDWLFEQLESRRDGLQNDEGGDADEFHDELMVASTHVFNGDLHPEWEARIGNTEYRYEAVMGDWCVRGEYTCYGVLILPDETKP